MPVRPTRAADGKEGLLYPLSIIKPRHRFINLFPFYLKRLSFRAWHNVIYFFCPCRRTTTSMISNLDEEGDI